MSWTGSRSMASASWKSPDRRQQPGRLCAGIRPEHRRHGIAGRDRSRSGIDGQARPDPQAGWGHDGSGRHPDAVGLSNPKIAMVVQPTLFRTLDGEAFEPATHEIGVRMLSMERAHRAVTLTGAMCVGVACRIEGRCPTCWRRHRRRMVKSGSAIRPASFPSGRRSGTTAAGSPTAPSSSGRRVP